LYDEPTYLNKFLSVPDQKTWSMHTIHLCMIKLKRHNAMTFKSQVNKS